jgi:hypothetical protein
VRAFTAALATALLVASGCGGTKSRPHDRVRPSAGTLDALINRPGPDVAAVEGDSDFAPGTVRFSFLVLTEEAKPVERPRARVWVASGRMAKPFAETTARLEPIGVPGRSEEAAGDVSKIYVTKFHVPSPGRYWLVAEPEGEKIQALAVFDVKPKSFSPEVGAQAPRSRTPTLADAPVSALTTETPPDRDLLHVSVADALAAHKPFVVTFATPRFCTSRTCGPVVDVVDAVRQKFAPSGVSFIHVEVFRKNDPRLGYNRWMHEWNLQSEPWTFLVGRDGRIKAKFEGSISVGELAAAVRKTLL